MKTVLDIESKVKLSHAVVTIEIFFLVSGQTDEVWALEETLKEAK